MKYFYNPIYLFLISLTFFANLSFRNSYSFAEQNIDIDLKEEIKKGNFLIGLKQYLGKNIVDEDSLIFKTDDNFLRVESENGLKHQSKEVKIVFKKVPLKKPYIFEKLVSKPLASFESAKKQSDILLKKGFRPIITMPSHWEIWLPIQNKDTVNQNFKIRRTIINNEIIPYLINKYTFQKLDGPISLTSDESIKINDTNYGRNFYLIKDSYGTWTLVQKLSFPDYLKGVLPHEIGANSPLEALKAQAVIARTWAIYNSNRFEADKFHLCVTTQCQVYKPPISNKNIEKAITDTKNKVLVFDDKPINAFYHASNGGISASSSESWEMSDYPYFTSDFDFINFEKKYLYPSRKKRNELKNFLNSDKNNFFGKDHHLFRWKKKVSDKEILNLLQKNDLVKISSKILDFKVIKRGPSGRVIQLEISLNNPMSSITLAKDDIRKSLNFLPSNLFIIDKLNDNLWVFTGGGFGHGVGLSQSGAIEMAKIGYSYHKILKRYYKKTKISNFMNLVK